MFRLRSTVWGTLTAFVALAGAVGCGQGGSGTGGGRSAIGNDTSDFPVMSADGRFVAFRSYASNLVGNDSNAYHGDTFVVNRRTGAVELVSVGPDGAQFEEGTDEIPAVSANGRYVAFSDNWDLYVRDRVEGSTELVSVNSRGGTADDESSSPALSGNGRFVAFISAARNLVPGGPNWPEGTDPEQSIWVGDVFVHDRRTGRTEQINVSSSGAKANSVTDAIETPAISTDGRFVAFSSFASNLAPGDTNNAGDVFLRDRLKKTTVLISSGRDGRAAGGSLPAISADGHFVAYNSADGQVIVRNRVTGKSETVSVSGGTPVLSANGRFVAFVGKDAIVVRDRLKGTTERVSVSARGTPGHGESFAPAISANGNLIAFASEASNLIPRDTNKASDIFVRNRARKTTRLISASGGQ